MALSGNASSWSTAITIREAVKFPDQTLVFLKYPQSARLFTKEDIICVFSSANDSFQLKKPPSAVDNDDLGGQIVRCPIMPRGTSISLVLLRDVHLPPGPTHRWNWLAYDAVIDYDNSTVVFAKGLNLRQSKVADMSRYECVYGWDFTKPNCLLRSEVISAAQEIVRCRTPLSVVDGPRSAHSQVKVSVRVKGRRGGMLPSSAHPVRVKNPTRKRPFEMCVCTMTRNSAAFLREWVMYHSRIGVQRWFIYDNNSDDALPAEIESLDKLGYNISRHLWPWIKTQEAGFAHCAIRARSVCDWVAFIDVDEFFYLPSRLTLPDIIRRYPASGHIGELRTSCHSFGPSGLRDRPRDGVTVGYTCRMASPERHKSIVRPETLNATLINVVHHFHLRDGVTSAEVGRGTMVINHYKYQVWEVFKDKFRQRVATYVTDWRKGENVGSKDRAPGLGIRPDEPPDWAERFCEVRDSGLRNWVLENFRDHKTQRLMWEKEGVKDEVRAETGLWAPKRISSIFFFVDGKLNAH
ncbi:PREDICTED: glycosyltransferase family 92 protein RCOM_0530710 [Tarenaya hassleriana]|uniref:glycosyltransferase family 92 protein RCOM_0530710 n=1 Tax=Tarenaya hassleriana TaxID=28532 RepID=UPI00053C08DB|nr:PREDICTED: glycosyltransferase family 92 protein RCOM_0530710 [Tarenaya hassleriana]